MTSSHTVLATREGERVIALLTPIDNEGVQQFDSFLQVILTLGLGFEIDFFTTVVRRYSYRYYSNCYLTALFLYVPICLFTKSLGPRLYIRSLSTPRDTLSRLLIHHSFPNQLFAYMRCNRVHHAQ